MLMNSKYFSGCLALFVGITFFLHPIQAQELLPGGRIWGNFQLDAQYYFEDSLMGAPKVDEKIRMNAFANINYSWQDFTVGMRFESYQKALLGYDPGYQGNDIAYRFASYTRDNLEVTLGNFYEQFGSGLILRSYEERTLGVDNAMDGIRLLFRPMDGITLKGLIGQQRLFFGRGPGVVRAFDAEANLNQAVAALSESPNIWILGASAVSKYQQDLDPLFHLPENVASFAGRLSFSRSAFNISSEFAYKVNDPSSDNNFIYKDGTALTLSSSWSVKGVGLLLRGKRIDNMGFRSDRAETGNNLHINYLPPMTRQHVYSLTGMYPYATQPNGEMGLMAELTFRLPSQTLIGGPFGSTVTMNYSIANSIHRSAINDTIAIGQRGTKGYQSSFFKAGDVKYFEDFNIEINRRFSRELRGVFTFAYITYNQDIIEGYVDKGIVHANVVVADFTRRLANRRSLRWELQHLATAQDRGNWAMAMLEYNIAARWFFGISDQYNYGNENSAMRIHYYMLNAGFAKNANRFSLSYGKQRQGVVCVGGICRQVPASNGFLLSVTSSF
jgi:hypothetical protein